MMRFWCFLVVFLFSGFLATASAQSPTVPTNAITGDPEAIRISLICAGCHGTNGASPAASIPIIGGQVQKYLADSMKAFRDGTRDGSVMNKLMPAYDDAAIALSTQWFAAQPWIASTRPFDQELAQKGKAVSGSCAGCHGNAGQGVASFPRIGGFPHEYLTISLDEYKRDLRRNPEAGMMALVKGMDEATIRHLSHYYSSMR